MKKNLTEMVFILDRSGSMSGLEKDTIGGFNGMIRRQKGLEGDALVSTVLFSAQSQVIHDRVELDRVGEMTEKEYTVGGSTALLDAIGDSVRHIRTIHRYIREEDRPEHTVFVITTDGEENSSHRYTARQVRDMVEEQKKAGWEFLFLGANMDAVASAGEMGIEKDRAVTFCNDAPGQALNYEVISHALEDVRACGAPKRDWKRKIVEYRESKSSRD